MKISVVEALELNNKATKQYVEGQMSFFQEKAEEIESNKENIDTIERILDSEFQLHNGGNITNQALHKEVSSSDGIVVITDHTRLSTKNIRFNEFSQMQIRSNSATELVICSNNFFHLGRFENESDSLNGISYSINKDGSISFSGVATENTIFELSAEPFYIPKGTYFSYFLGEKNLNQYLFLVDENNNTINFNSSTFTFDTSFKASLFIEIPKDTDVSTTFYFQLMRQKINSGLIYREYENWMDIQHYEISSSLKLSQLPMHSMVIYNDEQLPFTVYYIPNISSEINKLDLECTQNTNSINAQEKRLATLEKENVANIDNFINKIYPIGSIYLSMSSTNPSTLFNVGTWELISTNRMLIGAGDKYTAGATGGAETVTLIKSQVPKVEGTISMHNGATATNIQGVEGCFSSNLKNEGTYMNQGTQLTNSSTQSYGRINFTNEGKNEAHNNMPPYYAVYMWRRTA